MPEFDFLALSQNPPNGSRPNYRFNRWESAYCHTYVSDFPPVSPVSGNTYHGFAKVRLIHGRYGIGVSVIQPDAIFIPRDDDLAWFQPLFFTANQCFKFEVGCGAELYVDLSFGYRARVRFEEQGFIRSYEDGSQLFMAEIVGPHRLMRHASGTAHFTADNRLILDVYHHTKPANAPLILKSGHILPSSRNIIGDRLVRNWTYGYVTLLDAIATSEDLAMIAMAEAGTVHYRLDPPLGTLERVVSEEIYTQAIADRSAAIQLQVDAAHLVPQYLLRHQGDPPQIWQPLLAAGEVINPTYYEVFQPFNYRVGLRPGAVLPLHPKDVAIGDVKAHEFVLVGDTRNRTAIFSPLHEQGAEVWKIEMHAAPTIPQFWFDNSNQDLWTPKNVELQDLEP